MATIKIKTLSGEKSQENEAILDLEVTMAAQKNT